MWDPITALGRSYLHVQDAGGHGHAAHGVGRRLHVHPPVQIHKPGQRDCSTDTRADGVTGWGSELRLKDFSNLIGQKVCVTDVPAV